MKILYLVPDLFGPPGGIARYCRLVARALTESDGLQVHILALHDHLGTRPDLRYLRGSRWVYRPFSSDRWEFSRRAVAAVVSGGYDLLLSGHVNFTPLLHAAPLRPDRRITFIYGVDAWKRLPFVRRWCLSHATSIIAISQHTATMAVRANDLPSVRVKILHNCLDPILDPAFIGDGLPTGAATSDVPSFADHSILTVARMLLSESSKGHDAVIRALAEVRRKIPDAEYYVVGEGDQRPTLEALATQVGVRDAVHFLGRLSDPALQECYRKCCLFAMPSKEEGFGFVFLEAMAHARPVLAGRRDAGSEAIGENEAGLLVDPADIREVAEAIERILGDRDLQARLGQAGRERVARLFDYERFKQRLLTYVSVPSHTPESIDSCELSKSIEQ